MKTYFIKIDQYLLENYPTIWNTKIIWVLLVNIAIHILFFLMGFLSYINPESLQRSNVISDFFTEGPIFINLIISLLIIVIWLIMMFKNNSFKNFYPSSNFKLFSQFFYYFIIFLTSTTFYYSYMAGFKFFINQKYDVVEMNKKIETINRAAPFFSISLEDYTLDQRKFPLVFSKAFCETDKNEIEKDKTNFTFLNRNYQFYHTYSKTVYKRDSLGRYFYPEPEKTNKTKLAYKEQKQNSITYYFKKEVIDLTSEIPTSLPSYYNFSAVFYLKNASDYNDRRNYIIDYTVDDLTSDSLLLKESFRINQSTTQLLNKRNPREIEKLLSEFLAISEEFEIKTNLDAKSWLKLVYHPNNFEVKSFIKNKNNLKDKYRYQQSVNEMNNAAVVVDSAAVALDEIDYDEVNSNAVPLPKETSQDIETPDDFFKANLTDFYYENENLKTVLKNIDEVRESSVFYDSIHIMFWIAFVLSTLVFSYRVTNLRLFLFSKVTSGILILGITLFSVISTLIFDFKSINREFLTLYLLWFIGFIILMSTIFGQKIIKKSILGVMLVIAINGFIWYVLLHFGIISAHEESACLELVDNNECDNVFDKLGGVLISFICLILSFIFMYFYTTVIQKWRALPE